MALDVYLQKDTSTPLTLENRFLQFEDDGYFWFLYSFFEDLAKDTNELIDLYEGAFFDSKNLDLFDQTLQKVRKQLLQKPDLWEKFIGYKDERKVEKRFSTVRKKELELILTKLETAIAKAKENDFGILFFGD